MLSKKDLLKQLIGKRIDINRDKNGIDISVNLSLCFENNPHGGYYRISEVGEDTFEAQWNCEGRKTKIEKYNIAALRSII